MLVSLNNCITILRYNDYCLCSQDSQSQATKQMGADFVESSEIGRTFSMQRWIMIALSYWKFIWAIKAGYSFYIMLWMVGSRYRAALSCSIKIKIRILVLCKHESWSWKWFCSIAESNIRHCFCQWLNSLLKKEASWKTLLSGKLS